MTYKPISGTTHGHHRQRGTRTWVALLVSSVFLGALLLMVDFYKERPDLYQPARGYLMEAAMELSLIYSDEKVLANEFQQLHHHLGGAIDLLDKAQQADADDRQKIRDLRRRLQSLTDPEQLQGVDPATLRKSYDALIGDLNGLAQKLEKPVP